MTLRRHVLESDCVTEGATRAPHAMHDVPTLGASVTFLAPLWLINLCLKPGTWVFLHISTTVISETCKSLLTLINIQNFCFCFISLFYASTCWKIAILTKLRLPSSIVNISMLQEIPDPLHRPLSEMAFDNVKVLLPACGTWKRGEVEAKTESDLLPAFDWQFWWGIAR